MQLLTKSIDHVVLTYVMHGIYLRDIIQLSDAILLYDTVKRGLLCI